ncbi:MAG: RluA family pseudouridine synthase [Verrucomicrobiota bacterium]|jgi:23S rRNA pseudouridine1911/1915/1917 synthase
MAQLLKKVRAPTNLPQQIIIDKSLPQERLDVFLRRRLPAVSRAALQRLLAQGAIRVDGRIVKPTHHPRAGETLTLQWPEARPALAQAEDIPLDILYEDDDMVVLNKPAGLVVHPAAGHHEHTLVNALLHHCAGRLSGVGGVARPGLVHRLDKDTTGCLVAAKNDFVHHHLSAQFAGRQVEKVYHAIACGRMTPETGLIDAAIARHPTQRKRMAVAVAAGREARSSYRVLERWREASWVEVGLHTGRTHQVRVHLRHLGFPVVGDLVYGRRANALLKESTGYAAPRQLLHARRLALVHPRTGQRLVFEAPLPPDFAVALDFFRLRIAR